MNNTDTALLSGNQESRIRNHESGIQLYFTVVGVPDEVLKICRVVVIDVLRSATSIVQALDNGAQYVIPAPTVAAASDLASQLPRDDVLLCGEHDAQMIDGFNLGNSPLEYTRERVRGRRLIFASSNGSPALVKASSAKSVYLCGFVNLNAVIDAILRLDDPFPLILLCSGNHNMFSLEDSVCGGILIQRLLKRIDSVPHMNDGARAAKLLAGEFGGDFIKLLHDSDHGGYLKKLGMEDDLAECARDSVLPVVPVLLDGRLVILPHDD